MITELNYTCQFIFRGNIATRIPKLTFGNPAASLLAGGRS
jgi:porphobilinogen deaminase